AKKMDWPGFLAFTAFMVSILLALTFEAYGLSYRTIVNILLSSSLVSLVVFVLWELRSRHPLLDLRLFRVWGFTGGVIAQLLNAIAFGSVMLLFTLYFEVVKGVSAAGTGLLILPFDLFYIVFSLLGGKLSDKYGPVYFAITGLFIGSAALFILSGLTQSTPNTVFILESVLLGAGNGLFVTPNNTAIMSSVPANRRGIASALRNVVFYLGLTLSLNLSVLLLSSRVSYSLITKLVMSSKLDTATLESARSSLALAIGETFRVLGIINLSAAIFSFSRVKSSTR
ncbi:MAG: MFS transporter, partial [Infirmifilum sp.]